MGCAPQNNSIQQLFPTEPFMKTNANIIQQKSEIQSPERQRRHKRKYDTSQLNAHIELQSKAFLNAESSANLQLAGGMDRSAAFERELGDIGVMNVQAENLAASLNYENGGEQDRNEAVEAPAILRQPTSDPKQTRRQEGFRRPSNAFQTVPETDEGAWQHQIQELKSGRKADADTKGRRIKAVSSGCIEPNYENLKIKNQESETTAKTRKQEDDLMGLLLDLENVEKAITRQEGAEKAENLQNLLKSADDFLKEQQQYDEQLEQQAEKHRKKRVKFQESQRIMQNEDYKSQILEEKRQQSLEEAQDRDSYYSQSEEPGPQNIVEREELERSMVLKKARGAKITREIQPIADIAKGEVPDLLRGMLDDFAVPPSEPDNKQKPTDEMDAFFEIELLAKLEPAVYKKEKSEEEKDFLPQLDAEEDGGLIQLQSTEKAKIHLNDLLQFCYNAGLDIKLDFAQDLLEFFDSGYKSYFNEDDCEGIKKLMEVIHGKSIKVSKRMQKISQMVVECNTQQLPEQQLGNEQGVTEPEDQTVV